MFQNVLVFGGKNVSKCTVKKNITNAMHAQWFHLNCNKVTVVNKAVVIIRTLLYFLKHLLWSIYICTILFAKTSANLFSNHPQICLVCIYGHLLMDANNS